MQLSRNLMTSCVFGPIFLHVQGNGVKSDRIIVFCRMYDDCSALFQFLTLELASRNVLSFQMNQGLESVFVLVTPLRPFTNTAQTHKNAITNY